MTTKILWILWIQQTLLFRRLSTQLIDWSTKEKKHRQKSLFSILEMSYATWYLVFQYDTCFLKLVKFAVHTNFSKISSFVLKLRDRISVILFFSETKHLLMRIEVIKHIDQNRFFNYYILLSVFRTHKYLELGKEWDANSRQSFFQTLHILPRSLGSMCKLKYRFSTFRHSF